MCLIRFTFKVVDVLGKDLTTADTLSRAPLVPASLENLTRKEDEVVDYFSRYPEIVKLARNNTTFNDVINHLRSLFARHGIPEKVISDNGPQFIAADFANIAEEYGFTHVTTSLKYPQANGEVERATYPDYKRHAEEEQRPLPCTDVLSLNPS